MASAFDEKNVQEKITFDVTKHIKSPIAYSFDQTKAHLLIIISFPFFLHGPKLLMMFKKFWAQIWNHLYYNSRGF